MKPLIKYRGGKTKEIPHVLLQMPRFTGRYIEPFFGGGALFFHIEPKRAIINDINSKLMGFYDGVRNHFDTLRIELDEIEDVYRLNRKNFENLKKDNPDSRVEDENESFYYMLRDMYNGLRKKEYSDAALYYFINKTAYSGMIRYNSKGEFNVPYGRYPSINTQLVTQSHKALLQRAEIFNTDFEEVFNMTSPDDFMFLDPPYDCVFSDYGNEEYKNGFSEDDHRRLAQAFKNLSCKTLMIIGRTKLTEELYQGFIVEEYDKNYSVNIRNRFKSAAKHIVVANYKKELTYGDMPQLERAEATFFEPKTEYGTDK